MPGDSPPQGSLGRGSLADASLGQVGAPASLETSPSRNYSTRQQLPSGDELGSTRAAQSQRLPPSSSLGSPAAPSRMKESYRAPEPQEPPPRSEIPTYVNTQMRQGTSLHGALSGKILLRIIRAWDLRNTDLGILPGDASDPFVVARLGRKDFRTHVVENSLSPVWNSQQYEFVIDDDDAEPRLQIEVFSSNQWHANDSLGRLDIPIRSLTPGEMHTVKEWLDEGDVQREDRKRARIEIEVQLLCREQLSDPRRAMPGTVAHQHHQQKQQFQLQKQLQQQHLALMENKQKQGSRVPLPSFKGLGPEAMARPKYEPKVAAVGEARRMNEYESLACRLGQYDYSSPAPYYPKQDIIDKRQWKDDAFYGWRTDINRTERNSAPQPLRQRNGEAEKEEKTNESWKNDPFHGWLHHDAAGRPEVGRDQPDIERIQEANAARQLMSLPSFREAPARRFDDHREYASHAPGVDQQPRQRLRAGWGGQQPGQRDDGPPEQRWKDDAFFGWLPGRGQDNANEHKLRRPLEKARLARLPSFAEGAPELAGITGRGVGVLTVWVLGAFDLAYGHGSGLRGTPSACVKLRMANGQSGADQGEEKVTATIAKDANPRWNTPGMTFEVFSTTDFLQLEVHDLANPRSDDHLHNFFLGRLRLPIQQILEMVQRSRRPSDRLPFRERLEGSHQAQIDFECLWEPYDTEQEELPPRLDSRGPGGDSRSMRQPRQVSNSHHGVPSSRSFAAESDMGQLGILSVRVLAGYELVNTGQFGDVSSPFVTLNLHSQDERQKKRTKTISHDLNPKWESQPFLFPIQHEEDMVVFEVLGEDMRKSENDFLGRIQVPLYRIIHGHPNKPIKIRDRLKDTAQGELEVEIGFSPG
eukprot:TRINITY_DN18039_c0_g1_i1.p1 TRINITY_DN18039_c0_g1~~TRINITY_DN18039_c0_g1_i1.p1  ORF type:complete len:1017 (-),score=183.61 TRINITY_DN18039_c0_g1_i1:91-2694(-)